MKTLSRFFHNLCIAIAAATGFSTTIAAEPGLRQKPLGGNSTTGLPFAQVESVGPTVASISDPTVNRGVECQVGGDLFFRVGAHLVRVEASRWTLQVRLLDERFPKDMPIQACENEPLKVARISLFGPNDRDLVDRKGFILADGTLPKLKNFRDDFHKTETECRHFKEWSWCTDAASMRLDRLDGTAGTSPNVSVKFNRDFYATPTGGTFFVSAIGDSPFYLGRWGVIYRWDDSLVVAYTSYPCNRPIGSEKPFCTPTKYIEFDRDIRRLVERVVAR